MKINSKGMLSILVITILALSFALPFASVSALTIVNIDLTPPEDSQVGDLVTVSGAAGEVTSGATIRGFWDIAIGEGAILLNTTTGKPDGSYSFEITIPDSVNGTHYIWVEDVATTDRANSIGINITRKVKLKPSWGLAGDEFTVSGTGFSEDNNITLVFWNATGGSGDVNYTKNFTETPTTDEYGSFSVELDVPSVLAGKQNYGTFYINASDDVSVINATSTYIVGVSITITPDKGPEGTVIELTGTGFTANATLSVGNLTWDDTYSIPIVDDTITIDPNGEFSGYIVVPSWGEGTYDVNVSDKNVWVNETFTIDGVATIEVSPTYGSPGSTITLNGYNFTQIAGTEITLGLNDAEETGLGYVDTDADGTFETTFVSPAITFGTYDVWANDTAYGVNASDAFKVGLIAFIINPTYGAAGTNVGVTGIGFVDGTYSLTFGDELYEDHGTVSDEAISDPFYVPNVEPGTYDLTVIDTEENELTAQFTVTESTYVSMDSALGPNDYNVTIEGYNFADKIGDVDFVLYNSTDEWDMDVWEDGAGSVPAATDIDGNFTGWWLVLPEADLSLGDYTINVTGIEGLLVQVPFSVVAARFDVAPRKVLFYRGDVIQFDIKNDFKLVDSYIEIYDPPDYLYWKTEKFDAWLKVGTLYTVPYYLQTSGMNPMILSQDAYLGTWFWVFYEEGTTQLVNGTFEVDYIGIIIIINPKSGSAGTEVALTGIGFTPGTYNLTFGDILYEDHGDGVTSGEAISDIFYVPNVETGTYDVTIIDEDENELSTQFTVTDVTEVTFDPAMAPNLYNVTIEGYNFADKVGAVEFVIYNSTDEWDMDVWEDGAGSVPTATDIDGNFTGWWLVLPEGLLSPGDYTVNVTGIEGLLVQVPFSARAPYIPPVAYIDKPRKMTFYKNQTIEFLGNGTVQDGSITGYRWETSDGVLSILNEFTTSDLSPGTHVIEFSVKDDRDVWSEPIILSLEIKDYIIVINDFYVQPEHVVVTTGAGAAATGVAISQIPKPTPEKIRKIHKKKELKRQKKEERRNKKIKGKPFITWRIEAPNKLHCRCSNITIKLKNVGTADAKNIHIYIQSTYGLKLEKTHLHIQELPAGNNAEETIQFNIDPVVNNGLCKIIASINAPTLLEERKIHFIWVLKTGLVKSLLKTEEQEKITQWLNETEYHWGMIEDPGNYINLMGYDLIFINDSNLSEKSINNLTIFAEMGNKVIINDTIDNQNSLLLEPLGYIDMARDEFVIKTSKLEIVNSRHPLTKAYKINSIKQEAESIALVNPKLGSGKAVSIVKYKLNDIEEKTPFITMCKLEDGHMIHLNYKIVDKEFTLPSITKNIVEYFLDALYTEKVIPIKGKLRKK